MSTSRGTGPTPAATRLRAANQVFRLVAAVVLVAASPLVPDTTSDQQVRFGLVVALVWVPMAGVLELVARRRPSVAVDLAAVALDLSLLAVTQAMLHPGPLVPVVGHLLIVCCATYVAGRFVGVVASVVGCAMVAFLAWEHPPALNGFTLVLYPTLALTLCLVVDLVAADRSRASAGLLRTLEKSDAILTGVAEAIVVTTPTGRIGQWNRAAERAFGSSSDEVTGRTCTQALGLRHDVRELDCSGGCALLQLGDGEDLELWRPQPTGQRQPLLATAVPILDGAGRIAEVVHSFRDITRLKQADEAKTLFLATASHELKTPLTVIRGFSQMLLLRDHDMADDEREAALRAIDSRSEQLNGIVDRLLMSSRIDSGRIDLALEEVDVVPLLRERAAALSSASGRQIVLDLAPDLPSIWADADAVTTVVDHLLDNAIKYSPNGGPITIVGVADPADDDVLLAFADEGVGMTADQAASCFGKFWQAEPTDVRRFGGTGIGLYIVRSLVEGMGGSITVDSAPGEGSAFQIELQRADRRVTPPVEDEIAELELGRGDRSIIREYMRQLGIGVEV